MFKENNELKYLNYKYQVQVEYNNHNIIYLGYNPEIFNTKTLIISNKDFFIEQDSLNYYNEKRIRFDISYLEKAVIWANHSYCRNKKVGSILVKDDQTISDGYNGTPKGFLNNCEDENGETHWYTLHSETNLFSKISKTTQTTIGAELYSTLSPCKDCSKIILQSEIKRVIFSDIYKNIEGLQLLLDAGIILTYIPRPIIIDSMKQKISTFDDN